MTSSQPDYFPKPPPLNTIMWQGFHAEILKRHSSFCSNYQPQRTSTATEIQQADKTAQGLALANAL